jgi:hypothetical protein
MKRHQLIETVALLVRTKDQHENAVGHAMNLIDEHLKNLEREQSTRSTQEPRWRARARAEFRSNPGLRSVAD